MILVEPSGGYGLLGSLLSDAASATGRDPRVAAPRVFEFDRCCLSGLATNALTTVMARNGRQPGIGQQPIAQSQSVSRTIYG